MLLFFHGFEFCNINGHEDAIHLGNSHVSEFDMKSQHVCFGLYLPTAVKNEFHIVIPILCFESLSIAELWVIDILGHDLVVSLTFECNVDVIHGFDKFPTLNLGASDFSIFGVSLLVQMHVGLEFVEIYERVEDVHGLFVFLFVGGHFFLETIVKGLDLVLRELLLELGINNVLLNFDEFFKDRIVLVLVLLDSNIEFETVSIVEIFGGQNPVRVSHQFGNRNDDLIVRVHLI